MSEQEKESDSLFLYSESTVEQKELSETKMRTEKLDTEVNYPYEVSFDEAQKGYPNLDGHVFYNNQGTLSLATENFTVTISSHVKRPAQVSDL